MPRRRAPPRLYLQVGRGWVIRDGSAFIRTGCAESERGRAEKQLAQYLGAKHKPERGPTPLIADVLTVYAKEHLPHTKARANAAYQIAALANYWGDKRVAQITAQECRGYAETKSATAARRDLETLRAAVGYWHREYGPLPAVPPIVMPPKAEPRERWLTRSESARLLWAARRTPHLARFILLGIYTGSRSRAILGLQWSWVDLSAGVMRRRAFGEAEDAKKRTPVVRLGKRILTHLRRWKRRDAAARVEYLCHYDGKPVVKLRRSWSGAVQRAGLGDDVTPHILRHTRATWLMQAGIDPWEAAGHLGMSVDMLQRVYGKHSPDFQKRAAEV